MSITGPLNRLRAVDDEQQPASGRTAAAAEEPTGQTQSVEAMIPVLQNAVDGNLLSQFDKSVFLHDLGRLLHLRFLASGDIADLDEAIRRQREAFQQRPNSPDLPKRLHEFGVLFSARFQVLGDRADLDNAVDQHRHAVELLPDGDPAKAVYLHCLAVLTWTRFDRSNESGDLEGAVEAWKHAIRLTTLPTMHPASFVTDFFVHFESARASGALKSGLTILREHATSSSAEHCDGTHDASVVLPQLDRIAVAVQVSDVILSDIQKSMEQLLAYLIIRFGNIHNRHSAYSSDALAALRCAELLIPEGHWAKAPTLINLGTVLMIRFLEVPRNDFLEEAFVTLRRALDYTIDPSIAPPYANNLARVLGWCFKHLDTPKLGDPRQLLPKLRAAVDLIREEDPEQKARHLRLVGDLYLASFDRLKFPRDIDVAVEAYEAALRLTGTESSLFPLAACLLRRFEYFSVVDDVRKAIELLRQLVNSARSDDTRNLRSLSAACRNIGIAYFILFSQSKATSDLDAAVRHHRRAVFLAPRSELDLAALANVYEQRFLHYNGDISDIKEAINLLERTIENLGLSNKPALNADADNEGPKLWMILARCFASLYDRSHEPLHRERALQAYHDALVLMTDDHRYRLATLNNLVATLLNWDKMSPPALPHIIDTARQALTIGGPVAERLKAARFFAVACFLKRATGDNPAAVSAEELDAHQRVIDLIPRVAWLGHNISRRYQEMAVLSSDVCNAVATAATCGDGRVLTWFEQGRALVWAQIRSLRTHVDAFRPDTLRKGVVEMKAWSSKQPVPSWFDGRPNAIRLPQPLVERFSSKMIIYARKLQAVSAALEDAGMQGKDASNTRRLAEEREELLGIIRGLQGFDRFLLPLDVGEFIAAAKGRTIVCINMHHSLCRAIIVTTRGTSLVTDCRRLDRLTVSKAQEWRKQLNRSLGLQPARKTSLGNPKSGDIRHVLRELWNVVIQPILAVLQVPSNKFPSGKDPLPHVTWCTTGPLTFLPLHAAGPYDPNRASPSAFDLIVSSYTPNIASLLPRPNVTKSTSQPSILVVAQPNAPGVSPLPGTRKEAENIRQLFSTSCTQLDGAAGTIDDVLVKMATHPYVHLACHGEQDSEDPLQSAFILADGRLTLERLMTSTSSVAEFAFLSACETATGDENVPDEAVHLAAGMLAVGYRSVVATMWSIGDNYAPLVAKAFYETLLAQHAAGETVDVAGALHAAVTALRRHVGERQFVYWLPFVHWGI